MARRSSSLGPFPKTLRWAQVVEMVLGRADAAVADEILGNVRERIAGFGDVEVAVDLVTFFAALPIVTRSSEPVSELREAFGISLRGSLRETLASLAPADGVLRRAALGAFDSFSNSARFCQQRMEGDEWSSWRGLDGAAFCDLGRTFYAHLVEEVLTYYLAAASPGTELPKGVLTRHAWELSKITQSFSARWFNACTRETPDRGNIRWYLRHCLGKLDMELERELSTHVEPLANPFRRRKNQEPPSLGLPLWDEG